MVFIILEFNGVENPAVVDYTGAIFASMDSLLNPFFYALTNAPVRASLSRLFRCRKANGAAAGPRVSNRIAPTDAV